MKRITRLLFAAAFLALSAGGVARAQQYFWGNYAGLPGSAGSQDNTGTAARFNNPMATAVDSNGNVYVADTSNNTIRKITPAGVVTTIAGSPGVAGSADGTGSAALFNHPTGIAVTGDGSSIYVADSFNFTIRVVSTGGVVTTLAGTAGVSGDIDGSGAGAAFGNPVAVATDGGGNIYVADSMNNTIRKVTSGGVVTTLAGTPGLAGTTDGTGSGALFNNPCGIAANGTLIYVADTTNHTIRQVTPAGVVTTLAGTPTLIGSSNGTGSAAQFYFPNGLALDSSGNVYIADTFNQTIRVMTPSGTVTTLAGQASSVPGNGGRANNINGTGTAASFNYPTGLAVDGSGNVYIADSANNTIRKVSFGIVTTFAGGANNGTDVWFHPNGIAGPTAHFNNPMGIAIDSSGNAYVADTANDMIRKIAPPTSANSVLTVSIFAGNTNSQVLPSPGYVDSTGTNARFLTPSAIAADGIGNLYVTDTGNEVIRKIVISTLAVSTLCGTGGVIGSADGTTTAVQFNNPTGIAANSAGTLIYVSDTYNHTIRQITSAGVSTTIAGTANSPGSTDGIGAAALFDYPSGVAVDSTGNVYVADTGNCTIRKLTLSSGTWTSTTIAGSAGVIGSADGTGTGALFNNPTGLSIDSSNNLYVTDSGNHTIRLVTPAGVVTTLGGTPGVAGGINGLGTAGQFASPTGIAVGPAGLYIADAGNNRVSFGSIAGTLPATVLSGTSVILNGDASANGITGVTYEFQYGLTTTYASTTAQTAITGTSTVPVSTTVTLTSNAFYHYRLVELVNGVATYFGVDQTFITPPTVAPAISNTSLAAATTGIPYTAQLTVSANGGNVGPSSWSASNLPPGLSVNPLSGLISGVPTTPGTFSVGLSATNAAGTGATKTLSLAVSALPLPTFSALTMSAVVGSAFNYTITAANSPSSYGASNLPPGLVLTPMSNSIIGTPQVPGNYTPTLSATNFTGTTTATLNLTVLPTYVWSNLAGLIGTPGSADGQAAQIGLLDGPAGVVTDSNGNVYVADSSNDTIRKITPAGVMTTLAGSPGHSGSADGTGSAARFDFPEALAIDGSNNIYVADTFNSTIRKITPAGVVTTFAGQAGNSGSANGTGNAAQFEFPEGITVDSSSGNIYVVDNERIRAITPAGVVTSLAGTFQTTGHADGTGAAATFSNPRGIVADGHGNLYVSDTDNFTIRKVTTAGVVTTFAGTAGTIGFTDGTGAAAQFEQPIGLTIDSSGNLYVGDTDNEAIRKITPGAVVTTFAGGVFGSNNGTGTNAQFAFPYGLAADSNGNIYVADENNDEIRKITPTAVVTTIAGVAEVGGTSDGTEVTNVPEFSTPQGVAIDANDNVYVADGGNSTIREITPTGSVSTIAGKAGATGTTDGTGSAISFKAPTSLAFDSNGNLFVADSGNDTIRKLTHSGSTWTSTTFAGTAGTAGAVNATGTAASFSTPTGIAIDTSNNIYVADSVNDLIRKITPAGVVTTFAGVAGSSGSTNGAAASAKFSSPSGVAVDASGNVYVADTSNNLIREISAGTVSTVAGVTTSGFQDGIGTTGHFSAPYAIAVDGSGTLYVADTNDSAIRKIIPFGANWMVTTIGGNGFGTTPNGAAAQLTGSPEGVAVDAQGNVVVADTFDDRILIGAAILPPSINPPLTANGTQNSPFTYGITATNMPTPFSSYSATGLPANLSVNTITGAITGTPTGFGSFSPSISATNLAGSASATLSLSIASSQTPYQAWQSTQFNAGQLATPSISGNNATSANDGIPNLLKYSLGLTALQSYNPGAPGLPTVQVSGANYLSLTFTGTATDITYVVQATSTLSGSWTTIQTFSSGGTAPGTVTVQDTQAMTASTTRYMRLQVTTP